MKIRKYKETDLNEILDLFYNTINFINIKDYTKEQINIWAPKTPNKKLWNLSLLENYTLVCLKDKIIVGFSDITKENYINRFYINKNYQNKGIGSFLLTNIEKYASKNKITVHASITAKQFFKKRGYIIIKQQEVLKSRVYFTNYVMQKDLEFSKS